MPMARSSCIRPTTSWSRSTAKNGNVEWTAKNGDPSKGQTGTSAPMVVKDKVLVGISGGEFGVQCSLTAYNIKDGKQVWQGLFGRAG